MASALALATETETAGVERGDGVTQRVEDEPETCREEREGVWACSDKERRGKKEAGGHIGMSDSRSVNEYFFYYSKMEHQQNMLRDYVRTSMYKIAIEENASSDFEGKTVMDVGAGSGILSYFAALSGASRVYSVEASGAAGAIETVVSDNELFKDTIEVLNILVEHLEVTEACSQGESRSEGKETKRKQRKQIESKVDTLISEPIGVALFNERMVETYLTARDKFLKPNGTMLPSRASLSFAPFSDSTLYAELRRKVEFWESASDFHGIDMTGLTERSLREVFRQPVCDYLDPLSILSDPLTRGFDFRSLRAEELHSLLFEFDFEIRHTALVHGVAVWFDIFFEGGSSSVGFSTAPGCPPTHWYQMRLLLTKPLAVNAGQRLVGELRMEANGFQSYWADLLLRIEGTEFEAKSVTIDLKDSFYRQGSFQPFTAFEISSTAGQGSISGTTRSGRAYLNPSLPANQAVNQWFQELFEEDKEEMADDQQLQQQIANLQQQLAQLQTDLAQA
uniref:type I protein arginine methyltransferase n=1 Tax=Chromera velia CCMP2878 TaxID=1169474 RepID=A0A0G4HJJ8_9ALVE|eukprot:Cvel_7132.t1-p1 / transcript=Cvel_7132.t1 / gene=Cvel_7132 / organism=Chromera_velia_CCMP2878 / gene_product=Probable histone-arginine methyltransferase CARM1, putative / transcript_product=Probable histone-arginine methyltransferase CARM1, putative / location=Cvel_scaffold366:14015-26890(-) / protein_length=508 / sequence_SO=supercontig / SO=protein_coding / is_pseudo=false